MTTQEDKKYELLCYYLNYSMDANDKVNLWNDYAEGDYEPVLTDLCMEDVRDAIGGRSDVFDILYKTIRREEFSTNDNYFYLCDDGYLISCDDADGLVSDNEDGVVNHMANSGDYDDEIAEDMKDAFFEYICDEENEDRNSDRYEQLKDICDDNYSDDEYVTLDWDDIYEHICEVWDEKYGKPSAEQVLAKVCDAIRCNLPIRMNPVGANTYILFGDEYYVVDTTEWYELLAKKTEDDE